MPRFLSNGLLHFQNAGSDFQKNVAIRAGTSINLVLKFQVDHASFHGEEAGDRKRWKKKKKIRKRAIAKALQLKGHSDFAPVDLAYYQHFLFFCSKILRFGKFRLATTNTDLLT